VAAGTRQRVWAAQDEEHPEQQVDAEIQRRDEADERRPRHGQQVLIRRDRLEQAEPFAHDVEGAVAVEETLPAVAADDGAEPEIAVAYLRVGRDARRERTGVEG
jgi:hypothetical protein